MRVLRGILAASRPISWVNTAFPYGLAYLLVGNGLDWLFWVGVIFFLIPYNIAMYGINDVFDYESDILNPRKGGVELHPGSWTQKLKSTPGGAVFLCGHVRYSMTRCSTREHVPLPVTGSGAIDLPPSWAHR